MGTWGNGILENDKALDQLKYLMKADNYSLQGMLEMMTDSRRMEVQLLAAELTDIILNGRDKVILPNTGLYDEWLDGLYGRYSEEEKEYIAHIGYEGANNIYRMLNTGEGEGRTALLTCIMERLQAVPDKGFEKLMKAAEEMEEGK